MENMNQKILSHTDILRSLSAQDFLVFGREQVAYIKPVSLEEGERAYSLHAADGTFLTLQKSAETAALLARHNHLEALTVQ